MAGGGPSGRCAPGGQYLHRLPGDGAAGMRRSSRVGTEARLSPRGRRPLLDRRCDALDQLAASVARSATRTMSPCPRAAASHGEQPVAGQQGRGHRVARTSTTSMRRARRSSPKSAAKAPITRPARRIARRLRGAAVDAGLLGPPVDFHISSIVSIIVSSSFAAPASRDCFTFEAARAFQKVSCSPGTSQGARLK